MSIASEITRLQGDKADIQNALVTQGITAASTHGMDDFAADILAIQGGGGAPVSVPRKDVNFMDYDGTILYSYTAQEAAALDALPANPSHTGLTAQGWNYTLAEMKTQVTAQGKCDIGQMYITDDGKTRLYCRFEQGRLAPYLGICPNGTVTVDWGDGTATDTLTGTSLTTVKRAQHTYSAPGDYVITLTPASDTTFAFYGSSSGYSYVLQKESSNSSTTPSNVYRTAVKKIELGTGANIGSYAFRTCFSLATVTMPSGTKLSTYSFAYCYSLKYVTVASGVTSVSDSAFYYCYSLESVSISPSVTGIGASAFQYCYCFKSIVVPYSVTTINSSVFDGCSSLREISLPEGITYIQYYILRNNSVLARVIIPSTVTYVYAYAFSGCYGMAEVHFKSTTPPTLANSNVFDALPTDCKIYVPTGYLSAYTSASNYPSSSTYTYVQE